LATAGLALGLEVNAENFFLDETLMSTLSRRIGSAGKYLLVEAPYSAPLPALPDHIFRMKLKGVTPKDVKDNEAEAKRKSVEEFAAERKAARPQKTRVYNLTALIRNTLYLNARTNRWLKNIISLLNNQHDQIVPEAVG
jgi:hypothetical protein